MAADVLEVDAVTGVAVERDYTDEERAQVEADRAAAQAAELEAVERETAVAFARAAAIAHAKSLGFTDEMIAVMYPNLQMGA